MEAYYFDRRNRQVRHAHPHVLVRGAPQAADQAADEAAEAQGADATDRRVLSLVVKGDVQGSVETIVDAVGRLSSDKARTPMHVPPPRQIALCSELVTEVFRVPTGDLQHP